MIFYIIGDWEGLTHCLQNDFYFFNIEFRIMFHILFYLLYNQLRQTAELQHKCTIQETCKMINFKHNKIMDLKLTTYGRF